MTLIKAFVSRQSGSTKKTSKVVTQYSHIFFVSVRNFVCKMSEDAELLMTLYDAKEGRAFTENYVVRWSKEGLASLLIYRLCGAMVRVPGYRPRGRSSVLLNLSVNHRDLGSRDLIREKVYLVCYVVRVGAMEVRDTDHRRSSHVPRKSPGEGMRRPFGVAAMDVTLYLSGRLDSDEEKHHFIPFLHLKLLHGDIKQVREENPHLVLGNVAIARKMGFPEVILPGDVRNDLYLTLVGGEFSKGSKLADKNVEVTVVVCNDKGQSIPGVMSLGGGVEPLNEYRSVIYYHEEKPRWHETFKVAVPIDEFKGSHLRFSFKHRCSTESKDKLEKPFALSYVKLMQGNGTTLHDTEHDLLVYKGQKPQQGGLTLTNKDSFTIHTNVCSTKLTQNVDLLGLLNWVSHPDVLKESLTALMKVDGEEVVKFLQDVLDALFNILMQNSDSDLYDNMVFECLLYIIGLVSDRKYQHFQPVLDLYITESFSATLAYSKLIVVLKYHVDNANSTDVQDKDILLKTMKSLQYCMRFVVRSRLLFSELNEGKGQEQFEVQLKQLIQSITGMMCYDTDSTLLVQGACLKYLPSTIPDILSVFNCTQLSTLLAELINTVPHNRLTKQKMMTVNDIVHSRLFLCVDCREVLLPVITTHVKKLLESRDEVELCVKIISDIMELLFRTDIGPTLHDITEMMLTVLRTVIQTTIAMDRESPLVGNLVAVMLAIFRQMTAHHFEKYISHFSTTMDLLDFLMEILLVFKDLVSRPVFSRDWCQMIMLQNSVILKSLRFFSHTIRDYFFQPFEIQAWNNFFHCAIAFLTQPSLQLETFSQNKRSRIVARYKDMRRETSFEIRAMWFNLVERFENEMVAKLDILVEGGRGDELYKDLFCEIMMNLCEKHSTMREQGIKFVKTVTRLMERLLEYRCIITDENKENRMSCTVNLLDFYSEINRKEMYIRYVNKLCDLHLECDNYTEAAYTLKLHSKLLNWSDTTLPPLLKSNKFPHCQTHRELKEALYYHIMDYFDKGKMWECALTVCKELVTQYEEEIFDYIQLSSLLKRMSQFYDSIMKQIRPEPEYFRVAFYGRGFPAYKVFVYRGKEYERLSDFCSRTLNQLPNAELMSKLTPPGEDVTESQHQCILAQLLSGISHDKTCFGGRIDWTDDDREIRLEEVKPYLHGRRVENYLGKTALSTLDRLKPRSPCYRQSSPLQEYHLRQCSHRSGCFPLLFHAKHFWPMTNHEGKYRICFLNTCSDVQINKVDPLMDERKQRLSGKPVNDQILRYHRNCKDMPAFNNNFKVKIKRERKYSHPSVVSSKQGNEKKLRSELRAICETQRNICQTCFYLEVYLKPFMFHVGYLKNRMFLLFARPYYIGAKRKFRFSRPFHRRDPGVTGDADNEFASLWLERTVLVTSYPLPGILRWFPVTSADTYQRILTRLPDDPQVSPLRNAIETMEGSNRTLRDLIVAHRSDPSLQLNPLSMKINGIVDAAVMGGITNYEKAFFQPEYAETHSDDVASIDKLKDLIASQIPLLEVAIQLHRQRAPVSLGPFQQRLEECFSDMQTHVEHNYGKKVCRGRVALTQRNTNNTRIFLSMDISERYKKLLDLLSCIHTSSNIVLQTSIYKKIKINLVL
uniref:Dedicator of cytokinesis protein 1 n=1 Tax=Timema monikensis TaxID=170555 RepID=A0A7R9HN85_9NEOP|nr:unnamed protein product [Timema monikensis]